jgi:RimJ/RimL family protein N-acetyltransferase
MVPSPFKSRRLRRTFYVRMMTWARGEGVREPQLQDTEDNGAARRLYERCGFEATGRTERLPRKPALITGAHVAILGATCPSPP